MTKEDLHIVLVQCALHWEQVDKNLADIESYIARVSEADLIVLPELFSTAFSVSAIHLAESMDGTTVRWMKRMAKKTSSVLCGSVMIREKDCVYNRLLWVAPDGSLEYYDKRHLFGLISEDRYFTKGTKRVIVSLKGWNICPLICYDLRFPVFSRNDVGYDLLLYVANWPDRRIAAWDALLKARAIENQAYTIGVNRVGTDGFDAVYSGHTQVYNAEGVQLVAAPDHEVGLVEIVLTKSDLNNVRNRLPFLRDRDTFERYD